MSFRGRTARRQDPPKFRRGSGPPSPGSSSDGKFKSSSSFNSNSNSNNNGMDCQSCVPDNDPRIKYVGPWVLSGSGFLSTAHSTSTPGSTVSFNFTGGSITVFGTVPASNSSFPPPTVTYTIDAEEPFATAEPLADRAIANQPLFEAAQLAPKAAHSLVINVTSAATPFTLDFFFLSPTFNGTGHMPNFTAATPAAAATVGTGAALASASPRAGGPQRAVRILAGVLGSLVFLLLLALAWFLVRRRRQGAPVPKHHAAEVSTKSLRETIFTSTESILRNHPSWSQYTRSSRPRSEAGRFVQLPSPSPNLPSRFSDDTAERLRSGTVAV